METMMVSVVMATFVMVGLTGMLVWCTQQDIKSLYRLQKDVAKLIGDVFKSECDGYDALSKTVHDYQYQVTALQLKLEARFETAVNDLHKRFDTTSDLTCERQQSVQTQLLALGDGLNKLHDVLTEPLKKLSMHPGMRPPVPRPRSEPEAMDTRRHQKFTCTIIPGITLRRPLPVNTPTQEKTNETETAKQA